MCLSVSSGHLVLETNSEMEGLTVVNSGTKINTHYINAKEVDVSIR